MGVTDDRNDPALTHGADTEPVAQAEKYLVLSNKERAKGWVRPLRSSYAHVECPKGGTPVTTMGVALSETYARDPHFYGATYCCTCRMHRPLSEFRWIEHSQITDIVVGS